MLARSLFLGVFLHAITDQGAGSSCIAQKEFRVGLGDVLAGRGITAAR